MEIKKDLDDIPAEMRWEIAAKSATTLAVVYDLVFRKAMGPRYEAIELPVWIESGREVKKIANALGLASRSAQEVGEAFSLVSSILFGPELKAEIAQMSEDSVILKVSKCPWLNRAVEMGLYPGLLLSACQAYGRSAIDNLNPRYKLQPLRRMCAGDGICESRIELK